MEKYYLPPEWVSQSAVMLTWPNETNVWRPSLAEVELSFVALAREIAKRQNLIISSLNNDHKKHITDLLQKHQVNMRQTHIYVAPSLDVWARDHGPITVFSNEKPILLDFVFNGWGNKYPSDLDNLVTKKLHAQNAFTQTPLKEIDMVLEGGSIEVDGIGTLLTTKRCLLAPTRNPSLDEKAIEQQLSNYFGIDRILWLDHGYLSGDDTDSHIDTLARFCDPHTICYVTCDDQNDEHYTELKQMERQLKHFTDNTGQPYKLVPLPWPQAKFSDDGQRLPATYANFLIINGAVLVPTYDDPADEEALKIIQDCFLDREIVGIPALPIIEQYGSVHCVTMQLPSGVL